MKSARLSDNISPNHYTLFIEPNINNMTFKGKVSIELSIKEPSKSISLHSLDLKIIKAEIKSNSKNTIKIKINQEEETINLELKESIKGNQLLSIEFEGIITDKLKGLYYAKYGEKSNKKLITTQFEAPYARRCFPCFDEPSKKATFDFSISIPKNLKAISNMPIKNEKTEKNKKLIVFQTTPKMSTYLLYFAAGELEFLEGKHNNIDIRIVTTPEKSKKGKFALDLTIKFLKFFEEYSHIPYPLPKLDMIAVPDFEAGAMENWGAITFREILLLQDEKTSINIKKRIAEVIAHELWHQWSGNLVTMEWWEDLWLNESFATYMAYKAVDHYFPEWKSIEDFIVDETAGAFEKDSLKTTHSIAVKVDNPNQIEEIFDAISYGKGGSVLRMLESFLGNEQFRLGVSHYLNKYKYKNAKASDLWDSLAEFSDKPIKQIMIDWITKAGYPIIEVNKNKDKIKLKQSKFNSNKNNKEVWKIPLTIKTDKDTLKEIFDTENKEIVIKNNLFKLNDKQTGFYRTKYDEQILKEISKSINKFSSIDRYGIQNDLFHFSLYSQSSIDNYLDLLDNYQNESDYNVLCDLYANIREIEKTFSQDKEIKKKINKLKELIKIPYENKLKQLTFIPKSDEPQEDSLTRALSISYLQFAQNKKVLDFCFNSFKEFIKIPDSLHPDLKGAVLAAIAENGTEKEYKELIRYYEKTNNVEEKVKILQSLYRFKDKKILQQALDYALTDKVRIQELRTVFAITEINPEAKSFFFDWIKQNWSKLKELNKNPYVFMGIIKAMIGLSTKENINEIKSFLNKEVKKYEQTKANAFEYLDIYNTWFNNNKDILSNYLNKL